MTLPPWYRSLDARLLSQGWPLLVLLSGFIIGVTLYLLITRQAAPLAAWLVYLYMP